MKPCADYTLNTFMLQLLGCVYTNNQMKVVVQKIFREDASPYSCENLAKRRCGSRSLRSALALDAWNTGIEGGRQPYSHLVLPRRVMRPEGANPHAQ